MADGGLRPVEQLGQVASADLAGRCSADDADQTYPHRVGQRLQDGRQLGGGRLVQPPAVTGEQHSG